MGEKTQRKEDAIGLLPRNRSGCGPLKAQGLHQGCSKNFCGFRKLLYHSALVDETGGVGQLTEHHVWSTYQIYPVLSLGLHLLQIQQQPGSGQ